MKLTTKEEIDFLLRSVTPYAALSTAIETGLLWQLAEKPRTAQDIVQALEIPGKRGYYWLQLLEKLGILEPGPEGYIPSSLTYQAILDTRSQQSWQHLAFDERDRLAGVHDVASHMSEPGSIWEAQGLAEPKDYVEAMKVSPERAREFTRMLFEVHQDLAEKVADILDMTGVRRLMDFGGGSGVVSMALLRKHPRLTSTIVDMENVCVAGREIAAEEGLSNRISYHPADFDIDRFPTGFDMILQCDVAVYKPELFQKLYNSLKPGGRMVFVDHFSPSEFAAPITRVEWTFLDSLRDPDFAFPTLDQVREQLVQAGFEVSPDHQSIRSGLVVFEACKKAVL